ncbi:MAG: YtxH domain-containing protein [Bryobacterales bacterium]|nr:YtxH domain-containing protein [Bryobacterales bacterium]
MAKHSSEGNFAWFVAGVTVGVAGAILFAPKSGKETREQLAEAASKGREYASEQKQQATQFGRDLYEKGRDLVEEIKLPGAALADGNESEHTDSEQA